MDILKINEITKAVGGILICGDSDRCITEITTNSKQGGAGKLFVAIVGERFDGHDFIPEFLQSGDAVITHRAMEPVQGKCIIKVTDTLRALRHLAKHYRIKKGIPIIGITGSVGKTSTKDMVASVLAQKYVTHKTLGNFNNEIGLPLSVFGIESRHEISVLEMGMNSRGEISRLSSIAQPEVAVITNIGTAHIGNLGSVEGILEAKLEILERLKPDGIVILNGDDPLLWNLRGKLPYPVLYYGMDNYFSDITASDIILGSDKSRFTVQVRNVSYPVTINAVGKHHIYNTLAAVAVGMFYGMREQDIANGIAAFTTGAMRQSMYNIKRARIIEDCYNANLDSMKSAIDVLQKLTPKGNSVALLGDMYELGGFSRHAHQQVGHYLAEAGVGTLITVGEDIRITADIARKGGVREIYTCNTNDEALQCVRKYLDDDNVILIKASRGMKFEDIVRDLKQYS